MNVEKNNKKEMKIIVIIFVIVILLIVSILYYQYNRYVESHKNDEFRFTIEIIPTDSNSSFTIITPLPVEYPYPEWEQIVPSGFEDRLSVEEGNATFTIIESEHGIALEIISNGYTIINCFDPSGNIYYQTLSMQNTNFERPGYRMSGLFDYWVYSSSSISIEIDIECYGRWGTSLQYSKVNGTLSNNWNLISGYESYATD